MNPDRAIATIGFRRWYGRQLLVSHVCLVACFLCMILLAIGLQSSLPTDELPLSRIGLLLALTAAAGGVWFWNRYRAVFSRAERYGNVAHCEHCGSYARFAIEPIPAADPPVAGLLLKVRCLACGHRWTMPGA